MGNRPEDGKILQKRCKGLLEKLKEIIRIEADLRKKILEDQMPVYRPLIIVYPQVRDGAGEAEKLLKYYENPVTQAVQDLKIADFSISWIFSTALQKHRAFAAYRYLTDILELGLGPETKKIQDSALSWLGSGGPDLRQIYDSDPIHYYSKIRELKNR